MTLQQLPDFAYRSPGDYATAIDAIHVRYDPVLGPGIVNVLERLGAFGIFKSAIFGIALVVLVISIVICTLDRTPRLWRDVSDGAGRPARAVLRSAAARSRGDDRWPPRDVAASRALAGFHFARRSDRGRDDVPVRRPPPVHEARDAAHPPRARPVPRRRGRHLAVRRRAGSRRARGRVADRPEHRDPRPAARQEPRLRGARLRDRSPDRLHDRPRRLPERRTRSPARRSASTTRCRSAATRSTRTGSGRRPHLVIRDAAGAPLWDAKVPADRVGRRARRTRRWPCPAATSGLQLLLGRDDGGEGVLVVLPYRIVGTNADGNDQARELRPGPLHRGDDEGLRRSSASRSALPDFGEYTLLIAKRDPGQGIVWAAFLSLIAGITITFYRPRRRVWARLDRGRRPRPRLPGRSLRRRRARVRRAARRPRHRPPSRPA